MESEFAHGVDVKHSGHSATPRALAPPRPPCMQQTLPRGHHMLGRFHDELRVCTCWGGRQAQRAHPCQALTGRRQSPH